MSAGRSSSDGEGEVHRYSSPAPPESRSAHAAQIRLDPSGIVAFHQPLGDFAERRVADRLVLTKLVHHLPNSRESPPSITESISFEDILA